MGKKRLSFSPFLPFSDTKRTKTVPFFVRKAFVKESGMCYYKLYNAY